MEDRIRLQPKVNHHEQLRHSKAVFLENWWNWPVILPPWWKQVFNRLIALELVEDRGHSVIVSQKMDIVNRIEYICI